MSEGSEMPLSLAQKKQLYIYGQLYIENKQLSREQQKQKWIYIAMKLNSMAGTSGGSIKEWQKWRKTYWDQKSKGSYNDFNLQTLIEEKSVCGAPVNSSSTGETLPTISLISPSGSPSRASHDSFTVEEDVNVEHAVDVDNEESLVKDGFHNPHPDVLEDDLEFNFSSDVGCDGIKQKEGAFNDTLSVTDPFFAVTKSAVIPLIKKENILAPDAEFSTVLPSCSIQKDSTKQQGKKSIEQLPRENLEARRQKSEFVGNGCQQNLEKSVSSGVPTLEELKASLLPKWKNTKRRSSDGSEKSIEGPAEKKTRVTASLRADEAIKQSEKFYQVTNEDNQMRQQYYKEKISVLKERNQILKENLEYSNGIILMIAKTLEKLENVVSPSCEICKNNN